MRNIALIFSCTLLFALGGCGLFKNNTPVAGNSNPGAELALTEHNPVSLHNYRLGREYSAAGRHELAREHYLLAYAAAESDRTMQDMLEKELKSIDQMIKTLR